MTNISLKDLAKELNLSVSTVSRALRDSHEISPDTKEKVLTLAKKLNYQPNPYARSLRKQKSKTIAVVIPEIANNFFSLAINGIESIAQENDYHVLIYLTHEDYEKELSIINHLSSGRVDGVLVSISSATNDIRHLEELHRKDIPVVFFDRISDNINTIKVTTDDYNSGYKATNHLIDQGCKRIAFLSISSKLSIGVKRMEGYKDALKDRGINVEEKLIVHTEGGPEETHNKIKQLLTDPNRPDGLFASVEKLAIASYHCCHELNLSIPKDVKIISFSNLETASLLNPSLTTITQPAFEIGKEAARVLFKGLDKHKTFLLNKSIILDSRLIERESTAK